MLAYKLNGYVLTLKILTTYILANNRLQVIWDSVFRPASCFRQISRNSLLVLIVLSHYSANRGFSDTYRLRCLLYGPFSFQIVLTFFDIKVLLQIDNQLFHSKSEYFSLECHWLDPK